MARSRLFLIALLLHSGDAFAAQAVQLSEVIDIVDLLKQPQRKLDIAKLSEVVDLVQSLKSLPKSVVQEFQKISGLVREHQVFDGVDVYRLKALEQSSAVGGAWACGLHSLKNVLYVLQALQHKPMSLVTAHNLSLNLNNKDLFERLFLNGGTVQNPGKQSWMSIIIKAIASYKQNDGIFAGDTAVLLEHIVQGKALLPTGVDKDLLERVYPIDSFFAEEHKPEHNLFDFMLDFASNNWPAVAFILAPAPDEQHAIGIVFHKNNSPVGLEIFVLNSLNSSLNVCKPHVEELIKEWRQVLPLVGQP